MEAMTTNELVIKINMKKSKVLVCSKNGHDVIKIYLERNRETKQVENFMYLWNIISADGRSKNEIIKIIR